MSSQNASVIRIAALAWRSSMDLRAGSGKAYKAAPFRQAPAPTPAFGLSA